MKLYLDLKMNGDKVTLNKIEFGKLNIIAGTNGSGKSLLMKLAWYSTFLLQNMKIMLVTHNLQKVQDGMKEMASLYFKASFVRPEDISGYFSIRKEGEFNLNLALTKGELTYIDLDMINPGAFAISNIQQVNFASKDSRTFTQYIQYKKMKSLLGITLRDMDITKSKFQELCELHPLYDVMWFEQIEQKNKRIIQEGEAFLEKNPHLFDLITNCIQDNNIQFGDVKKIGLADNGCPTFIMEEGNVIPFDTLGSGSQSIIMLSLYSYI
jgi:hypothetical protein